MVKISLKSLFYYDKNDEGSTNNLQVQCNKI